MKNILLLPLLICLCSCGSVYRPTFVKQPAPELKQEMRTQTILIKFSENSRSVPFANELRYKVFQTAKGVLKKHSLQVQDNYGMEEDTAGVTLMLDFDVSASTRDYGLFTSTAYLSSVASTFKAGENKAIFEVTIQKYHAGSVGTLVLTTAGVGVAIASEDRDTPWVLYGMGAGILFDIFMGSKTSMSHWEEGLNKAVEQGLEQFLVNNGL